MQSACLQRLYTTLTAPIGLWAAHHWGCPPGGPNLGCFLQSACLHRLLFTLTAPSGLCAAHHWRCPLGSPKTGYFSQSACRHRLDGGLCIRPVASAVA